MSIANTGIDLTDDVARLENWIKRNDKAVTVDHYALASLALKLGKYYRASGTKLKNREEKKNANRVASNLIQLALDTLGSGDAKRIHATKEWFRWLDNDLQVEDSGDEVPLQVSLAAVVDQYVSNIKDAANGFNHNPGDLPKDWKGTDIRVIKEGSGHKLKIAKGARMKRLAGARIAGGVSNLDGPIIAVVHEIGGGSQAEIEGDFEDYIGPQIGYESD